MNSRLFYSEFQLEDESGDTCRLQRQGCYNFENIKPLLFVCPLLIFVLSGFQPTIFSFSSFEDRFGVHAPFSDETWWFVAFTTIGFTFLEIWMIAVFIGYWFAAYYREEWSFSIRNSHIYARLTKGYFSIKQKREFEIDILRPLILPITKIQNKYSFALTIKQKEAALSECCLHFVATDGKEICSIDCLSQNEAEWIQELLVKKYPHQIMRDSNTSETI